MAIAAPALERFSLVTITGGAGGSGDYGGLLEWPSLHSSPLAFTARTAAERRTWAARLDELVARSEKQVLIAATGAGCLATAWWARLSPKSYVSRVAGALLFAPDDHDQAGGRHDPDMFASPRIRLPFPSVVVDDAVDDIDREERLRLLAEHWGSRFLGDAQIPRAGSGPRAWRQAQAFLQRVTAGIVEQEVRTAEMFAPAAWRGRPPVPSN